MQVDTKLTPSAVLPLASLRPHPRNYNRHSPSQIQRIAASLTAFGQVRAIVVWRSTILAGHGVVEAARQLGWTDIRADVLPDDYPEHLALAYVVADNELARLSDPDEAALAALLDEARAEDAGLLAAMGYDEREFQELLARVGGDAQGDGDAEPQVDRAEELRQKWGVESGDLWRIGEHRLICGDCTDAAVVARVMGGERAGACVTDPPFGIDFKYNEHDDDPKLYESLILSVVQQSNLIVDNGFVFVWQAMLQCGKWGDWFPPGYRLFAGVKNFAQFRPTPVQFSWDPIVFWQVGKPNIKPVAGMRDYHVGNTAKYVAQESNGHPCPRPEDTVTYIIDMVTDKGALVFDPFLGSGTTLVACQNLARRGRGIEISPAYVAVTLQRMADAFPGIVIERIP